MRIVNNEIVLDNDKSVKLLKICGVYIILNRIVFSLNDGKFLNLLFEDDGEAIETLEDICKLLRYNPNFLKIEGKNALINMSQVYSMERIFDEDIKQFGVILHYANQEICIWDQSKSVIDDCFNDLKNNLMQFGINVDNADEILIDENEK